MADRCQVVQQTEGCVVVIHVRVSKPELGVGESSGLEHGTCADPSLEEWAVS